MLSFLIILVLFSPSVQGVDICSRTAIINYQEVLVDTNNNQKGEGLRHYLEKDETAKHYLDLYQEGTKVKWQNTIVGPLSVGLILTGLTLDDRKTKRSLLFSGATLMLINFLVAATLDKANEQNLTRAIEEYNRRNFPKIHFSPNIRQDSSPSNSLSFVLEKSWSF